MKWQLVAMLLVWVSPAAWSGQQPEGGPKLEDFLEKSRVYRQQLQTYSQVLGEKILRLREEAEIHRAAYEKGLISLNELEAAQESLRQTEHLREEQQRALVTLRHATAEIQATFRPSDERAGALGWIRNPGSRAWDLKQFQDLDGFFQRRFGRELPVSANGQTETHLLLGFNHEGRIDVAVHPRSPEGAALITVLQELDLPFTAFDGPREGSATGAHIHLGPPSPRMF